MILSPGLTCILTGELQREEGGGVDCGEGLSNAEMSAELLRASAHI